jgi:hypothetical protein
LIRGCPIAQIIFHILDEPTEAPYEGKYQDQRSGPVPAIFERKEIKMSPDKPEGDWIDVSQLESIYEVQYNNETGDYRHRIRRLHGHKETWLNGQPPEKSNG